MPSYDNKGFITNLDKGEILVFGSNGEGNHAGGAAKTAHEKFGAIMSVPEGLQGKSYAINTMDGIEVFKRQAYNFIIFAEEHPKLTFLMTPVGTGIAGYTHKEAKSLFKNVPKNVILPKEWV